MDESIRIRCKFNDRKTNSPSSQAGIKKMISHKNFSLISLFFACIHLLFNQFYYGNHFFIRPIDYYFMTALSDMENFRRDTMISTMDFSPYLLLHKTILFIKNLFGFSLYDLLWALYFFANWALMAAYFYFSKMLFGDKKVSILFLGLLAFNFAPWTFGSAFGLNTHVMAPNMVAIIFQLLAIAFFLRTDKNIYVAVFLAIAFYLHVPSTFFLSLAMILFILYKREAYNTKEIGLSFLTGILLLIPFIVAMSIYASNSLEGVTSEVWELEALRHSVEGHISLSLIWESGKAYHLMFYFVGLAGFIFVLYQYGNKQSYYDSDKIEKIKFITAILLCAAVFFSLASDLYLKFMTLQTLKSALWFIQLFIGVFIVKVISDVLFSAENYKSKHSFIPYLYAITILCATLKLMDGYNMYLKFLVFILLFTAYFFREKLSFLIKKLTATNKDFQMKKILFFSCLLIFILVPLLQKWVFCEESKELYMTGSAYSLHNKNWDDIVYKVNELPSSAYILYLTLIMKERNDPVFLIMDILDFHLLQLS